MVFVEPFKEQSITPLKILRALVIQGLSLSSAESSIYVAHLKIVLEWTSAVSL